ncbi:MAG TPA: hypothetical protein VG323_15380 [Thermoanaerobaculia bacterium]|nr:hypothetical protein [Thermoanaerobaculia bacterium]
MIDEIFLGFWVVISVGGLAFSIWKVWRDRPRLFRPWQDSALYLFITWMAVGRNPVQVDSEQ